MNRFAVLAEGFERLSYPLGACSSYDKQEIYFNREEYVLHRLEGEAQARMLLGSADWISSHASLPVGFVQNASGSFIVCRPRGKKPSSSEMDKNQRREYSLAVMLRLAQLHSEGFGCGGIWPHETFYFRKEVFLSNPASIFALCEQDSLFHEAAVTLRRLLCAGFASQARLSALAGAYLSHSPVCRNEVRAYLESKKSEVLPAEALAAAARKYAALFL
ncbi:MAG: hypothetical protein N3E51_00990 [Candidatus Micrarchaeota archaeon]|nr:hypothetical protein [Candidatus Micrarchaeota archaeon]